jgi:hypothetical protein
MAKSSTAYTQITESVVDLAGDALGCIAWLVLEGDELGTYLADRSSPKTGAELADRIKSATKTIEMYIDELCFVAQRALDTGDGVGDKGEESDTAV